MSKKRGRTKAPPKARSADSALQAFLLCGTIDDVLAKRGDY